MSNMLRIIFIVLITTTHLSATLTSLIELSKDPESVFCLDETNGWSPLHYAAFSDNPEMVVNISSHSPETLDIRTNDGKESITALDLSMRHKKYNALHALLKAGANPDMMLHIDTTNDNSDYIEIDQASKEHTDLERYLNKPLPSGKFLLHKAITWESQRSLQNIILLQNDINVRDAQGLTALHYAVKKKRLDALATLLDYKANPNIPDYKGIYPLHSASLLEDPFVAIRLIVEEKTNLNVQDNNGDTPLHYAARTGNATVLASLLAHGASDQIPNKKGDYALHLALNQDNHETSVIFITTEKINYNVQDAEGNTALHLAVKQGKVNFIPSLLKRNANPEIKNKHGETPVQMALAQNNLDMIFYFIAHYGKEHPEKMLAHIPKRYQSSYAARILAALDKHMFS